MPTTATLKLGDAAPEFSLPGVDGKTYHLKELVSSRVVCVIFMCNHCPYVKAAIDRIIALQQDYTGKGVQVIGVNSNETVNHPEDSLEHMIRWAKEKRFNFPYLAMRARPWHGRTARSGPRTSFSSTSSAPCATPGRLTITRRIPRRSNASTFVKPSTRSSRINR